MHREGTALPKFGSTGLAPRRGVRVFGSFSDIPVKRSVGVDCKQGAHEKVSFEVRELNSSVLR